MGNLHATSDPLAQAGDLLSAGFRIVRTTSTLGTRYEHL